MLFSPMKATLKFLIERMEFIFVDSVMIELDLNDHKSEFTKVVVLSMCHIDLLNIYTVQTRDRNGANILLPASSRPEKNSHRPDSPRAEFHLCSPPRLQKIHLFFENIIYLIIQYKGSVNKIGTHAEKCVQ